MLSSLLFLFVLFGLVFGKEPHVKVSKWRNNFLLGSLSVIGSQFCWSTIEIAGTFVYRGGANPLTLLSVRYLIASIIMFLTIFIINKNWFRVKKKDIKTISILGLILLVHLLAFWQGIKTLNHIPTAIGVYFTFPIWIVVLSAIFRKEKISKRKSLSLISGLIGSLFVIGFLPQLSASGVNIIGVGLMFISAICRAVYAMVGKNLFKKYNPITLLFYTFIFVLFGTLVLQNPTITLSQVNTVTFPNLVYMGLVCTYLAFILFYNGVKKLKSSTVGIVSYIKPILSVMLAFIILHQTTNLTQAIGIVLIVISGYLIYSRKGIKDESTIY